MSKCRRNNRGNGDGNGNGGGNQNGDQNGNQNGKRSGNGKQILEDSAEFIIIALLLSGDLKLQSILVDREGNVDIIVRGMIKKINEDNAKKVADFLSDNGSMTVDEVIEGLRRSMR